MPSEIKTEKPSERSLNGLEVCKFVCQSFVTTEPT